MPPTPRRTKGAESKTPRRKETAVEPGQSEIHGAGPSLQGEALISALQRTFQCVSEKTTLCYDPEEQAEFVETSERGSSLLDRSRKEERETPKKRTRSERSNSRDTNKPQKKRKSLKKSESHNARKASRPLGSHEEQDENLDSQEIEQNDTVVLKLNTSGILPRIQTQTRSY